MFTALSSAAAVSAWQGRATIRVSAFEKATYATSTMSCRQLHSGRACQSVSSPVTVTRSRTYTEGRTDRGKGHLWDADGASRRPADGRRVH
jgi:hypothetical protein